MRTGSWTWKAEAAGEESYRVFATLEDGAEAPGAPSLLVRGTLLAAQAVGALNASYGAGFALGMRAEGERSAAPSPPGRRWPGCGDEDPALVCLRHMRFLPCRFDGPHSLSGRPADVDLVRRWQRSPDAS